LIKPSLHRWIGRVPDLSAVIARFPVAAACMAIFTAIWIFTDRWSQHENLGRMLVGLVIAAYFSVIITLTREGQKLSKLIFVQIILAAIVAGLFWFSKELRLNLPMPVGAILLLLGNAVLWTKPRDDLHVWDFTHKIWTGAGFAFLGSIIFFLGVMAIQEALKSLFGLNIIDLTEHLLLPIGLGLLAPLYWLSTVPRVDEPYDELIDNPGFVSKAVAFLGTWLLSPLTLIYAVILLAYAVKILIAGALPKGEIAQLTTPFLLIGTLTWLVLEPPFIKEKALAKLFRKVWFPISIPAAIMLAIAVFVRVGEYGFTPERVLLMLIVSWSLGLGFWFAFGPKDKRDIRIIPGFGAALLFIGTLGSGWLSIASQYSRLDSSLSKAVSETDGRFEVVDKGAAKIAKGSINYLTKERAEGSLRKAFAKVGYIPKDDFKPTDIYEDLNLEGIKVPTRYDINNDTQNFDRGNKPIVINEYDQILGPYNYYYSSRKNGPSSQTLYSRKGKDIVVAEGVLKVSQDSTSMAEFDLLTHLEKQIGDGFSSTELGNPIIMFDENHQTLTLQPIRLRNWDNEDRQIMSGNVEFYILSSGFDF